MTADELARSYFSRAAKRMLALRVPVRKRLFDRESAERAMAGAERVLRAVRVFEAP